MDKSKILSAYIFLILATALWGGNIVAAKIASNIALEPIKLSFFRNLVVIFLLLPFVFQKISIIYSIFKKNWKIIIFQMMIEKRCSKKYDHHFQKTKNWAAGMHININCFEYEIHTLKITYRTRVHTFF